jgi:hypothetical protein
MADAFLKQYGGSGTGSDDCTAKRNQVLAGVTAVTSDSDDEAVTGTMPERGKLSRTLSAGESVTLSEGHYTGGSVSARNLASQTSGATAEDRYVVKGKTYWKDGVLRTGTMETQSAISFSAAARSYNTIRISWKNPAKGPWQGIIVRMSTSGTPGTSGGSEVYRGAGNNPNQAGGDNYVDISGLNQETQYYFTCTSYFEALGNGDSANISATTGIKSLREILSPYSDVEYWRTLGDEEDGGSLDCARGKITATGDNDFSVGSSYTGSTPLGPSTILIVYQHGINITHIPISDEDLRTIEKYSFRENISKPGQNFDLGKIKTAKLRTVGGITGGTERFYAISITGTKKFSGFYTSKLGSITFYKE